MTDKGFKSGFVSVVGVPNVGKSTLINKIVGQKISIISDKPQTTRNKILAIYTTEEEQIVFIDTPGIHKPRTKLGEYMIKTVNQAMDEIDAVMLVADVERGIRETERKFARRLGEMKVPAILVLNKIDRLQKDKLLPLIADYSSLYDFDAIVPISAKTGDGIQILLNNIKQYISEGPKYYYDDMVTDQPERQIAAEIIREKMLWTLDKEIPHGIAIEVTQMKRNDGTTVINATVYCEKASHKGIIIGKNGEKLKQIGTLAREDIEKMIDGKVYLDLWVRVKTDWRNNNHLLKNFGYEE